MPDPRLGAIVIASSATLSGLFAAAKWQKYERICISAPATLQGTVSLMVPYDTDVAFGASNVRIVQSGGSDVTVPADKAIIIKPGDLPYFALESDTSETGGSRTFIVYGLDRSKHT